MAEPGTPAEDELAEIAAFGYERARDELVNVVKMLEQGGLDLDDSLTLWERGEALANRCEEHLAGARRRVEDAISRGHGSAEPSE
ncbi:exodeoxyribonuclease VII small subunit [Nocardia panacis]|uniref:Exodeoxyribonuclease 7 small subunit n=1 Tax=Nocardia panacis TaxID=2340916 RepID=A0A3A4KNJ8_9NOCA|nr:exodeoxyribonuclease VII small subunit [Nocardia panacis]RJO75804.1 exodeoxyribonuclease VII small subunit [Nocardia panacis]